MAEAAEKTKPSTNPTAEPTRLMNAREVAQFLRVSPGWVYEHSAEGAIPQVPSFKLGKYRRYRLDEIERWLAKQREGA